MVQPVNQLSWAAANDERGGEAAYLASVPCAFATDPTWRVNMRGNVYRDVHNIPVNFVLVDNYSNDGQVVLNIGGILTYRVGNFERKAFRIPDIAAYVEITMQIGTVNLTFSNVLDYLVDGSDQFAIQQAAAQFVNYQWITKSATTAQAAGDQNKFVALSNVAAQNYNLLAIGANAIPNGWYNPAIKNVGAGRWSVVPAGADQINSLYTAAAPLLLSTGDQVQFSCDGTQWQAEGFASVESPLQGFAAAALLTFAHGLAKVPRVEFWWQCLTAELNFQVGDRLAQHNMALVDNAGSAIPWGIEVDATNVRIRQFATAQYNIVNATTGAFAPITIANWNWFVKCSVDIG